MLSALATLTPHKPHHHQNAPLSQFCNVFCTYISVKCVFLVLRGEVSTESTALKMVTYRPTDGHRQTEFPGLRRNIYTIVPPTRRPGGVQEAEKKVPKAAVLAF